MHTKLRPSFRWALASLFFASASFGCGPKYSTLQIDVLTSPPVLVNIKDTSIQMPMGAAVHVAAVPISDSQKHYTDERMVLDPEDAGVFQPYSTNHPRRFVFVAIAPGETCMRVILEGEEEDCIPVTVTSQ